MSFVDRSAEATALAELDIRSPQSVMLRPTPLPVAATPGVAIGSAMVAAAWTGAQVGDVAD